MTAAVLDRGLRLRQRSMAGWAFGSAAFTAMVIAIFPVVRDDPTFDDLLADYPEPVLALLGGDIALTTGAGFLSAELYSLVLPVLVAVIAVTTASAAFAGEDERGWLALVLAGPIDRDRVVLESAVIVAVVAAVPVVASAVVVVIGGPLVDLDLALTALAAASITTWMFGLVFGAIALLVGGIVGRRSTALACGVGAIFFAYGAEIVGATAGWGRWLQDLSPFHHLVGTQAAVNGVPAAAIVISGLGVLAAVELAARFFARRDLVR